MRRPRYNRERHYGSFINCHRRVICSAMRARGWAVELGSIALAYLIAAFIRTVMSRSFNEARSMLPREIAAAPVIYGYGATISTLPPQSTYFKIIRGKFFRSRYNRFHNLVSLFHHFLFSHIKIFPAISRFPITFFLNLNFVFFFYTKYMSNHRCVERHSLPFPFLRSKSIFTPSPSFLKNNSY